MSRRPHLHALTGLRFLAALHVWLYHSVPAGWADAIPGASGLLGTGTVSVSLFFVLSGFVLAYVYLPDTGPASMPVGRFAVKRIARIYPVYALSLLIAAPYPLVELYRETGFALHEILRWSLDVLPSVFLVHAWTPGDSHSINMVAWTLSVEAFFYVTFPWVVRAQWFQRMLRTPMLSMLGLGGAVILPVLFVYGPMGGDPEWLRFVNRFPLVRWPEFLLGVVVGSAYLRYRAADGATAKGEPKKRLAVPHLASAAGLGLVGLLMVTGDWPTTVVRALALPLFVLLIWGLSTGRGRTASFLSTRPMRRLGDASYALYLLHVPFFLIWLSIVEHGLGWEAHDVAFRFTYFAVTLGLSLVTFRYFEAPMQAQVRQWIGRILPSRSGVARRSSRPVSSGRPSGRS